jgi:hypothetical protein
VINAINNQCSGKNGGARDMSMRMPDDRASVRPWTERVTSMHKLGIIDIS